jgi:hypothetical protein
MNDCKIYRAGDYEHLWNLGVKGWVCEDSNGDIFVGRSAQEAFDHFKNYHETKWDMPPRSRSN